MRQSSEISSLIPGLNGKDYAAYQSLLGHFDFGDFQLIVDRIPKDPYAPSFTGLYRAFIPRDYTYIPSELDENPLSITAFGDYMIRQFYRESAACSSVRGTGNSGLITIDKPGQAILQRNSLILGEKSLEVRFFLGLPAEGRLIKGELAQTMILKEMPDILRKSFYRDNVDREACLNHIKAAQRGEFLRESLGNRKLTAFVADGSILPRRGGNSELPMDRDHAVPFVSPDSLAVDFILPDGETVRGMGIPEGITLITGGGYHGKSTLLQALAAGIYNHVPGDGRELVVTRSDALKIRSYSGRSVKKVNISPFINNLPDSLDTTAFSTDNASGSTSQAAAVMEGLEAGVKVFLMDEDTCASNFMIRDALMQQLVMKDDEPITPLIDRIGQLSDEEKVSSILVLGGSGDYFASAHSVIQMKAYRPFDVTAKARSIAGKAKDERSEEGDSCSFSPLRGREPQAGSVDPFNDYGKKSVYVRERQRINMGKYVIDLTDLEQLFEISQTKALTEAMLYLADKMDGQKDLRKLLQMVKKEISEKGLDGIASRLSGNLAEFRMIELASALNRLRSLKIR